MKVSISGCVFSSPPLHLHTSSPLHPSPLHLTFIPPHLFTSTHHHLYTPHLHTSPPLHLHTSSPACLHSIVFFRTNSGELLCFVILCFGIPDPSFLLCPLNLWSFYFLFLLLASNPTHIPSPYLDTVLFSESPFPS